MTETDTQALLETASRVSYAAYLLTGGATTEGQDSPLRDGDLRRLESALRAPLLPRHVEHTIRTALDAYTRAALSYSQSGGRSSGFRPPWEQEF